MVFFPIHTIYLTHPRKLRQGIYAPTDQGWLGVLGTHSGPPFGSPALPGPQSGNTIPEEELRDPQHPAGLRGSRGHEERRQEVVCLRRGTGATRSAPSWLLHKTRGGLAEDQHFLQYHSLFIFFSIGSDSFGRNDAIKTVRVEFTG